MKRTIACIFLILTSILMMSYFPVISGKINQENFKDHDLDGVPDHLDYEDTNFFTNNSSNPPKAQFRSSSFAGGNWSFKYDSDSTYGAWVGDVVWKGNSYIYIANIPYVIFKLSSSPGNPVYEIPNDFRTVETGCTNLTHYYQVYMLYSIERNGYSYDLEILWKFWKTPVNNTGKIDVSVLLSTNNVNSHLLSTVCRIDFDLDDSKNDCHNVYGANGWGPQNSEANQRTTNPVDPIWGMKVRQQDFSNSSLWGGIKARSIFETNYLLKYNLGEYKQNPINYVNHEYTLREDDVLSTTASTTGVSPLFCGPALYLH